MKRTKILGLALVAVFAMSVVAVSAAQAEKPVWITKEKGHVLKAGEEKPIKSKKVATATFPNFTLHSSVAIIVCKNFKNTGKIIGGKPGTDLATVTFEECSVEGKTVAECGASNTSTAGVVEVKGLKTVLVWDGWTKQRTEADDAFFPEKSTNSFVKFTLSGTKCGSLEEKEINVKATGTEVKEVGGAAFGPRKCGVLAEVGKIVAGPKFARTKPGEVVIEGGLNFPEPALTKAELEETATAYAQIECKLEVDENPATVTGTALVELETSPAEAFGFE